MSFIKPGAKVFIRTVTMFHTGKVVAISDDEILLDQAAWIADTGRFANSLLSGVFSEVEPFPEGSKVVVNRKSVIDMLEVDFDLPTKQK